MRSKERKLNIKALNLRNGRHESVGDPRGWGKDRYKRHVKNHMIRNGFMSNRRMGQKGYRDILKNEVTIDPDIVENKSELDLVKSQVSYDNLKEYF